MSSVFHVSIGDRTWRRVGGRGGEPPAAPASTAASAATGSQRTAGTVASYLAPHPPQLERWHLQYRPFEEDEP